MSNFDLSALALAAVCPGNEILYDDKGMPSVMVKIPKMTFAQLGVGTSTEVHPAFIVNGREVDAIYISKYQNIVQNGRAYSLPAQDPRVNVTFDQAVEYCAAKGDGWHLMTRAEWAMIALWCKNNGFMPWGNNNYGKDTREANYKAIPTSKDGANIGRVATGTGPLKWSHDGTPAGIWDLNGNVWEWVGGLRTVYGELQVLVNNNAADGSHSQAASGAEWMAIDGTTGEYIAPNGAGTTANSLKLDYVSNAFKWITGAVSSLSDSNRGCTFEAVSVDGSVSAAAILKLQALGLYKHDMTAGAYEDDYFYWNNGAAERCLLCGGDWNTGVGAGVFYPYGYRARSYSYGYVGFRSAFVKLPTD
ncbi:MAG: SUMF1/EgtB/PvdO family nonheme iron enzyme [Clostridia bacterium]|nr:SUMF1/EgtB/PvdO family nonheme iron enzyme [Clostridia bacterium]